jgi:hypothetical protein
MSLLHDSKITIPPGNVSHPALHAMPMLSLSSPRENSILFILTNPAINSLQSSSSSSCCA